MRLYSQSFLYDDSWPIVSLAFLLRYPNPYARHVVSCDVVSRTITPQGTLSTTRLILKRGHLPKWAPKNIVNKAESWIIEESEVDPFGKLVRCRTKNLDHIKVMQVQEFVELREAENGGTLQTTQAQFVSHIWGLTKRIENHGLAKFKSNIQKSREGVALVLKLLRESRLQALAIGPEGRFAPHFRSGASTAPEPWPRTYETPEIKESREAEQKNEYPRATNSGAWSMLKAWISDRRL